MQREDETDDEEARRQGGRAHGQDPLPPERDRTAQQGNHRGLEYTGLQGYILCEKNMVVGMGGGCQDEVTSMLQHWYHRSRQSFRWVPEGKHLFSWKQEVNIIISLSCFLLYISAFLIWVYLQTKSLVQ